MDIRRKILQDIAGDMGPNGVSMTPMNMTCQSPNNQFCVTASFNSSTTNWYACADVCAIVSGTIGSGTVSVTGCCQTSNCNQPG